MYNDKTSSKEAEFVKKKKTWIKWVILLILAAAVIGGFLIMSGRSNSAAYTAVPVTRGDLTTYYNFDGLVQAPRMQTLTAQQDGTVRTVYVSQNDTVRKGDRIYRLEDGETVEADIAGEVTALQAKEGDFVAAGATVAQIIDMDKLEIQLDVDEYDVKAVAPGSEVSITILATEAKYEGVVSALDKNGTASGDLSYYKATVPMQDVEGAYPGMQVSAKVLRDQVTDAVLMRADAVQFDEYNVPFVYVDKGGAEPEKVPVTVGVSDGVYCQIVSGVQEGDAVMKPTGMSMMELMLELDAKTR